MRWETRRATCRKSTSGLIELGYEDSARIWPQNSRRSWLVLRMSFSVMVYCSLDLAALYRRLGRTGDADQAAAQADQLKRR